MDSCLALSPLCSGCFEDLSRALLQSVVIKRRLWRSCSSFSGGTRRFHGGQEWFRLPAYRWHGWASRGCQAFSDLKAEAPVGCLHMHPNPDRTDNNSISRERASFPPSLASLPEIGGRRNKSYLKECPTSIKNSYNHEPGKRKQTWTSI